LENYPAMDNPQLYILNKTLLASQATNKQTESEKYFLTTQLLKNGTYFFVIFGSDLIYEKILE